LKGEGYMKVVIFTQAYNAEYTISRTIDSIISQTFTNFEYYILDNGCTDRTWDIIQKYSESDNRIIPIQVNINDPTNGGTFFYTLIRATNADYIVWCDADDTYSHDFLENMIAFSDNNQLDIAACGYDMIDGCTGKLLKHRALESSLVLYGNAFEEKFIQYRGFTLFLWGKLYSIPFVKYIWDTSINSKIRICDDCIYVIKLFEKAKRAGIYGKAMYQYYQYPRSLSRTNLIEGVDSYKDLWAATESYIKSYGPVSKRNEDFLYAVHLSLIDESIERVFESELDTVQKLELLDKILSDPVWPQTLARKASPEFCNLAARGKFVKDLKDKILSLPMTQNFQPLIDRILSYLIIKEA